MSYPSDLSDRQWQRLEKFFERPDPRGARSKYPERRVVEAVLYRLRKGLPLAGVTARLPAVGHRCTTTGGAGLHAASGRRRSPCSVHAGVEIAPGRSRRVPRHAILGQPSAGNGCGGRGAWPARWQEGQRLLASRCRRQPGPTLGRARVRAANKANGAEAGTVMRQAAERHPSIERFTADTAYKRQAERVAREQLGVELHVTAKPKRPRPSRCRLQKGAASSPSSSAG